jgi:hypothetical protein
MHRTLRWLIAFALSVAGFTFVVAPATAASAGYCTGSGVNVLVDSGALGAGVVKGCGQGTVAHPVFDSAGFALSEIHTGGMSGFVCTVTIGGQQWPSDGHCTGANGDGYWGLFIASPGKPWVYASLGADSLPVSNGQTVAFAWQAPGGGTRKPAAVPATAAPTSTVRTTPTVTPTKSAATSTATPSSTPTPRASATGSVTADPTTHATPVATATASTWSLTAPSPSSTAKTGSSSGLPWWIPVGVGSILVGVAVATWWRKRVGG